MSSAKRRCSTREIELKFQDQPYDQLLLKTYRRIKHYKATEDRIFLKNAYCSWSTTYGEAGGVKYYQVVIPKQLVEEVFGNLHEKFVWQPGITRTITTCREKY